jgi:hypothetical protein
MARHFRHAELHPEPRYPRISKSVMCVKFCNIFLVKRGFLHLPRIN